MTWSFETEPELAERLAWMREFVREAVFPLETLGLDHATFREVIRPLQERVKEQGLWAAHLGPELGGQGYGQVRLALMHEILGASELAPMVFGCQAPDSGNAEILAHFGTRDQRERWLDPLLAGKIESAFSMTEQGTGSDPKQFTGAATLVGDEWVIDATKYFVSSAEWADFHILMVVTEPDAEPHGRCSMLIVPSDAPGVLYRPLGSMSDPECTSPVQSEHEVRYDGVHIPADHLLGERGAGFAIAQSRLGPGRIHHCMRWIGVCRRAFDALCERAVSISVHGGPLSEKQMIQDWIATSAAEIESTRLLTLQAAWRIDQFGARAAHTDIAMIKYHGALTMHNVLDRAIQVHGALGYSTDLPFEHLYRRARAARLYDGPDEVHKVTVARRLLRGYVPTPVPTDYVPTRRARALERYGAAGSARLRAAEGP